jgi:transcriptional regulator with XRE-family HTH domain
MSSRSCTGPAANGSPQAKPGPARRRNRVPSSALPWGPYSNAEAVALIAKITGQQFSHTTIWKLRNGQAANPQMQLIEALAQTIGVPPAFFFNDYDEQQADLLREQVEILALIRDADVTTAQLRTLLQLSPEALQAVTDLIKHTTGDDRR